MEAGAEPGDFATVLRRLRERRSLTQEELAERAGLTAKAIGALERGERRRPYPHTVRCLADGLELDEEDRAALVAAVPRRANATTSDPPSPASIPTISTNPSVAPPTPATPFIGRDAELEQLRARVRSDTHRLITVTGPGGVGKTRLAMEVLRHEAPTFPDGALAVDLAMVREPGLVIPRIAAAFGVSEAAETDPLAALFAHLLRRRVLLVLDNLEQLVGAAPLLADLVARCPDLVVVATSRAPLRVRAEHEMTLSPLPTPADDEVATVASSPSAALLLDRAAAAGSSIEVSEQVAPPLAAICRRLDGLPLALELAAPGLRLLSPSALLLHLEQTDLGRAPRDLPERHRTMSAVLEWSMDLLEPEEVELFERLSVFSGGFSLDSVSAVAEEDSDVLPQLSALLDQSLVQRTPAQPDQPRFRLLEPVRQFAMHRLQASRRATATADRHAAHFHAWATAYSALLEGPDLVATLDRLEADHANLRSAYLRLLELARDGEAAELVGGIWPYLALRGHAREGLTWLERIGPGASDVARCRALSGRFGLLLLTGDIASMRRETDEALVVARRAAEPALTCEILTLAGQGAVFAGALEEAEPLLTLALLQAQSCNRPWVEIHARLAQCQLALAAGTIATASSLLPDVVRAARLLGNPFTLATALNVHATLTELTGDEAATATYLGEAVTLSLEARMSWTLGYALPGLASLAQRVGEPRSAAWLFGAGASIAAADAVDPTFPVARELSDQHLTAARRALGEEVFAREWHAGRAAGAPEIRERCGVVMRRAGA